MHTKSRKSSGLKQKHCSETSRERNVADDDIDDDKSAARKIYVLMGN